eukprot:4922653-Amphidinium_carterae.1
MPLMMRDTIAIRLSAASHRVAKSTEGGDTSTLTITAMMTSVLGLLAVMLGVRSNRKMSMLLQVGHSFSSH